MGGLAGRYASALLELAEANNALDKVADDLRGLKAAIDESEDLRRLLRDPVFTRDQQAGAMAAILDRAGVGDLTRRFVMVVARNRRLLALPRMIAAYLDVLAKRRGEARAEVTAAKALGDDQHDRLIDALRSAVGSKVRVEVKVDPGLIGGLIVKVGSRMVDTSLRTKLRKLQLAMKGVG